ncbi:MAG: GNAT family N-acetyltransferase [Steroidobacteraceae bacterium]
MSSAMIEIRPAVAADVEQILQFIRELARYERLEHEVVATTADLRESLFGAHPFAEAVFACRQGEPVGFALFFHNFSTFKGQPGIYLEDLYVKPHMRGQGIGRQLLRHLARLAVERRCARLEWAVLEWNAASIAFYRSLGAQPLQDWRIFRLTGEPLEQLATREATAPLSLNER